jgi:phenylalanyl-tRNA synthetase beta subunit
VLFEFGKAHRINDLDEEGLPREYKRLALVWAAKKSGDSGYFVAKRYLETLTPHVRYVPLSEYNVAEHAIFEQLAKPFEPKRAAVVMDGDDFVGVVGEYKASVRAAFKLPQGAAGFEVFQTHLMKVVPETYKPLSRFPKVTQDISLKVDAATPYASVFDLAEQTIKDNQPGECDTTVTPLSIYQSKEEPARKTITLRLSIASYEKTLTDKDVSVVMDAVAAKTAQALHAERI